MCIFVLSIIFIIVFTVALNVLLNLDFLVTLASPPLNGVAVELWLVVLQKLSFYWLVY